MLRCCREESRITDSWMCRRQRACPFLRAPANLGLFRSLAFLASIQFEKDWPGLVKMKWVRTTGAAVSRSVWTRAARRSGARTLAWLSHALGGLVRAHSDVAAPGAVAWPAGLVGDIVVAAETGKELLARVAGLAGSDSADVALRVQAASLSPPKAPRLAACRGR